MQPYKTAFLMISKTTVTELTLYLCPSTDTPTHKACSSHISTKVSGEVFDETWC